ncbi:MAG: asparaginase domain-containing protein [Lawsonella sp.]
MKHISVISTGGTIASTQGEHGAVPTLSADKVLDMTAVDDAHKIQVCSLLSKDSSALTLADVELIQDCVEQELKKEPAGIVLLHGTDTLESTALWLTLTSSARAANCPVIITGAIKTADAATPDGPRNIAGALSLIAEHARGEKNLAGVSVFFDGILWDPWGLTKVSTEKEAAFHAPRKFSSANAPYVPLSLPLRPLPSLTMDTAPLVPIVTVDVDDPGFSLEATVRELAATRAGKTDAVILCGLGSGNLPPRFTEKVLALKKEFPHLLWFLTTKVPEGTVATSYGHFGGGAHLSQEGVVLGGVLKVAQLRLLVLALISAGYPREKIEALLTTASL